MRTATLAVILVLLSGLLMGLNLGGSSLHNQDEAKHAVVARETAANGNWLSLTYNGRPYFNKPPLRIWLTALAFQAFGTSEWAVRLASAVFGLFTVLAVFLIGRRIYGERTAFLAALILLTSHQYLYNHCVRTGETDSMLVFCWTLGLLLLQISVLETNRRLLYLAAAAIGLCGMVKHLGFVPIILMIAVGWVLLTGSWRSFPARTWSLSVGISLAMALPWHLYQWLENGRSFIQAYFLSEILEKRLEAAGGGSGPTRSGPWASLSTMARGFFPWSCLLPFAIVDLAGRTAERRRWLLPTLWLVIALGMTIVSGRKFTWYVLPAFPAAALLVAGLLDRFLGEVSPALTRLAMVVGGLVAFLSTTNAASHNPFEVLARQSMLAVHFLGRIRAADSPRLAPAIWILAITGLCLAAGAIASHLGVPKRLRSFTRWLLVCAIVGLALSTVVAPLKFSRTTSPLDEIAHATDEHLRDQELLTVCLPGRKMNNPLFHYYFGEKRLNRRPASQLSALRSPGTLVLTDVASLERARDSGGEILFPREPLAQARGLILLRTLDY